MLFRPKHPGRFRVLSAILRQMYMELYIRGCFTTEDIVWAGCVSIRTDGAVALPGMKKGFQAEVWQIAPPRELYALCHL
jgi:hypothetical protein